MTAPYLDTSALAKWYLNEDFSDEVEQYLHDLPSVRISSLTRVEFRCLLARRRRYAEISPELEMEILARFQQDIRSGHLQVLPLADEHAEMALEIMGSLPDHALRTLDALHLAIARAVGAPTLATADRIMASAAEAMAFEVRRFLPSDDPPSQTETG